MIQGAQTRFDELFCVKCQARTLQRAALVSASGSTHGSSAFFGSNRNSFYGVSSGKTDLAAMLRAPLNPLMIPLTLLFTAVVLWPFYLDVPLLALPFGIVAALSFIPLIWLYPRYKERLEIYRRLWFCPICGTCYDHVTHRMVSVYEFQNLYN